MNITTTLWFSKCFPTWDMQRCTSYTSTLGINFFFLKLIQKPQLWLSSVLAIGWSPVQCLQQAVLNGFRYVEEAARVKIEDYLIRQARWFRYKTSQETDIMSKEWKNRHVNWICTSLDIQYMGISMITLIMHFFLNVGTMQSQNPNNDFACSLLHKTNATCDHRKPLVLNKPPIWSGKRNSLLYI